MQMRALSAVLIVAVTAIASPVWADEAVDLASVHSQAEQWRAEHRTIDMHMHIDFTPEHLGRATKIMDAVGIGVGVNLGTGTVTRGKNGDPSAFEANKALADKLAPGRLLHYMLIDYAGWDDPDWSQKAVKQIEEGHRLGAAGLKEFKRLGLYLRDGKGHLLKIDDPKLDPVWERCGELNMPISIHVADPRAFWEPYDEHNERWKELKGHRAWWFGDKARYPAWKDLLVALNRVIARHPKTTFVCVHFANDPEELEWVDQSLTKYPNMMADLAARMPELGRHDPKVVHDLFMKYQDRILFGTDFMVYDRLILGSSGPDEPPPTDHDAEVFYSKEWRWLETLDRDWEHMTPIQGDWKISSIGLPAPVLRKIYFDNARKLLARSLPVPAAHAAHVEKDFVPDGDLSRPAWKNAPLTRMEYFLDGGPARAQMTTSVRSLWSSEFLYIAFESPYKRLSVYEDAAPSGRRIGLWKRDVVEAFIGLDHDDANRYAEFEVSPTNERLEIKIDLPRKDFDWQSKFESAVRKDEKAGVWTAEMRIPMSAIGTDPTAGSRLRVNFFRNAPGDGAFLAWNPTLENTTHVPQRFGTLVLDE